MPGAKDLFNKNKGLDKNIEILGANPHQYTLFKVEKQVEVDEIEMGVLENGVPFLTGRGLERMCGIGHGPFHRLYTNWQDEKLKPRGRAIKQLLEESGYYEDSLFLKAVQNGKGIFVFTEPVCIALLEYYALYSEPTKDQAKTAYRTLAKTKFREFIYDAVGYSPEHKTLDVWQHFHDRVDMTMDAVPMGYFSVFREIAQMIVPMIRSGIMISDKVVPDISVGITWAKNWKDNELDKKFGERIEYNHEYPLYYSQAASNPQPAKAYPDSALGEFRQWLRVNYITNKFPKYLLGQTKKGKISKELADKAIESFTPKELQDSSFNQHLKKAINHKLRD